MLEFTSGLLAGIFFKNHILYILKVIVVNSIKFYYEIFDENVTSKKPKIFFLAKITNSKVFESEFPDISSKFKVQPHWDYYKNKGVIKIEIEQTDIKDKINFDDFLNNHTTLDVPFFEQFSDLFLYIHYLIDDKEYINVYTKGSILSPDDFTYMETSLSKKYNNLICASVSKTEKTEYITNYFRKYLNNRYSLTTEMLLLNYDKLDILLNNSISLIVVNSKVINTNSINDYI
jgi:hypothetical protein